MTFFYGLIVGSLLTIAVSIIAAKLDEKDDYYE